MQLWVILCHLHHHHCPTSCGGGGVRRYVPLCIHVSSMRARFSQDASCDTRRASGPDAWSPLFGLSFRCAAVQQSLSCLVTSRHFFECSLRAARSRHLSYGWLPLLSLPSQESGGCAYDLVRYACDGLLRILVCEEL